MLLIQQSSSFRAWTSRALMVYFRRALLFLVVSPRQNSIHDRFFSPEQQQQQTVCFSDAEDDEETMINDKSELVASSFDQREDSQSKGHSWKEYVWKEPTQAINNSMSKSIEKNTTNSPVEESIDPSIIIVDFAESSDTEQLKPATHNLNQGSKTISKLPGDCIFQYQSKTLYSSQQQLFPHPHPPPCFRLSTMFHSENLSTSSEDEDDIYEKYQTSFSHILHQTKSLNTIRQEDKLHSMLVLEPNTSIISVRPLTYHPFKLNTIDYSIFTSHIRVRLIAYQTDPSIHCDAKPIGCQKRLTSRINSNQNKNLQAASIFVDIPYKTFYIDTSM